MKHPILHDLGTSASFKEKSFDHFKRLEKLKLRKNFYFNLILLPREVMN